MQAQIYICNSGDIYRVQAAGAARWITERRGAPGRLEFTVIKDSGLCFTEGDAVKLQIGEKCLFHGYVFTKKRDRRHHIAVVAYDQTRYLMNRDSLVAENMTASELITSLAGGFGLRAGVIAPTAYRIPAIVEDGARLLDIIYGALEREREATGREYVLFDDAGLLCLRAGEEMESGVVVGADTGENFSYTSTIDDSVYNSVKLVRDGGEGREIFTAHDESSRRKLGTLAYFGKAAPDIDGEAAAHGMLSTHNIRRRKLAFSNVFGDTRVRAGSLCTVTLDAGDIHLCSPMRVERCEHIFEGGLHFMNLDMSGGEFVG